MARTPLQRVVEELSRTRPDQTDPAAAAVLDELLADPDAGRARLCSQLRDAWRLLIEPWWARLRDLLDADLAFRARMFAAEGLGATVDAIHDRVRWAAGAIDVQHDGRMEHAVRGAGLVLQPSAFSWPSVVTVLDPDGAAILVYPVRGIAGLWRSPALEPPVALARLLGPTRAKLLADLDEPRATSVLARRHDLGAPGISAHLQALHGAGLLRAASRRPRGALRADAARGRAGGGPPGRLRSGPGRATGYPAPPCVGPCCSPHPLRRLRRPRVRRVSVLHLADHAGREGADHGRLVPHRLPGAAAEPALRSPPLLGLPPSPRTGELIVNRDAAGPIVRVFRRLYANGYEIRRMRLVDAYGGNDYRSIEADNTSAFNCRFVDGTTRWSNHAFGRAIDVNPLENPYVSANGTTSHPRSRRYVSRSKRRHPAMILRGDRTVRAFASQGWGWGGNFSGAKDSSTSRPTAASGGRPAPRSASAGRRRPRRGTRPASRSASRRGRRRRRSPPPDARSRERSSRRRRTAR